MTLGELIRLLELLDPDMICHYGFGEPHSWRGIYSELAFEPWSDRSVRDMLTDARGCLGQTFTGYKGGEYSMSEHTEVHISNYGESYDFLSEYGFRWMLTRKEEAMRHYNSTNLPESGWVEYRKTGTTRMIPVNGPFTVETKEGEYALPEGWQGFVAIDSGGYPYPIELSEHTKSYVRARERE